ncbi:hypothetical protein SLEP1_g59535 [Rubroshorea leprosula]|uniref:Uncharacterized protein n=1 Tax=Rubroshorea leprosula TaxID=152421 RepID=A0AAV5MTX0_9ROSI|nr:hypothetical protein SLEP1_g59535 [Rubroshorea leprosula]
MASSRAQKRSGQLVRRTVKPSSIGDASPGRHFQPGSLPVS